MYFTKRREFTLNSIQRCISIEPGVQTPKSKGIFAIEAPECDSVNSAIGEAKPFTTVNVSQEEIQRHKIIISFHPFISFCSLMYVMYFVVFFFSFPSTLQASILLPFFSVLTYNDCVSKNRIF